MSRLFAIPPWTEVRRRLVPLIVGLVLCGVAFGCIVKADLGLDPWDVLHQGISDRTGIPIGTVSVLVSLVVILGWIPLRQRLGLGTVLNALLIGMTMDVVIPRLPHPGSAVQQWGLLVAGLAIAGPGIGMYIGARLGPGPRDGIMTGLAERGPSIRLVRTGIELTALAAGWLLGGDVGIGTVLFALTVGPNAQFWLGRLDLGFPPGFEPVAHADGHHADDPPPDVEPDFTISGT
ncbi:MAG TPA: YitT family protein [Acidimicrobiales bacterium]|nr:YitT family protein [Acidimicrobiales bacterium]